MFRTKHIGWIGFDPGARCVKVAQIVRRQGEYLLRSAAIVPRQERWTLDQLAGDTPLPSGDDLATAASLCDRLTGSAAAAILPAATCEILQTTARSRSRKDSSKLLHEVQAQTHRSLEDCVVDVWPVAGDSQKVNVVAAPRAWSDQISADVASTGRYCRLIDALPWALTRAAMLCEDVQRPRTFAVLDWAYGKASITLVEQGIPVLVRPLKNCGFSEAVAAVASGLRLSEQDAELVLQRHTQDRAAENNDRAAAAVDDILASAVTRMTRELQRTLNFWQGPPHGMKPQVVYLFGGGVLAGAEHQLTKAIGVEVRAWRLPLETPTDAPIMPPTWLLGPAVGLSAMAWGKP
jgi:Tfp pilus assembly PilM family ATPase